MSYRKLFDGHAATASMSVDEMLSLCARIRSYHEQGMMGALAIVATAEQTMIFARLLGALASAERPIKVFDSPRQARNWIEERPRNVRRPEAFMPCGARAPGIVGP